jgi:hypothetical protein
MKCIVLTTSGLEPLSTNLEVQKGWGITSVHNSNNNINKKNACPPNIMHTKILCDGKKFEMCILYNRDDAFYV